MRFVNTDTATRSWNDLVNVETGRTLELGPQQSADVKRWVETENGPALVEPDIDFSHPFLRRVLEPPAPEIPESSAATEPAADTARKRSKE